MVAQGSVRCVRAQADRLIVWVTRTTSRHRDLLQKMAVPIVRVKVVVQIEAQSRRAGAGLCPLVEVLGRDICALPDLIRADQVKLHDTRPAAAVRRQERSVWV